MKNMFIKLTRLDGSAIWINASFVVTVEPRKGGGSIVVPIGDGLDYDVREKAEDVLTMLGDAPAPAVVPVPSSDCLTKTPEDVSPEPEKPDAPSVPESDEAERPAKRAVRAKAAAKKPRAAKKRAEQPAPSAEAVAEPAPKPVPAKLELDDGQVERLKKMMPGSLRKLQNTLLTQFIVADVHETIRALAEKGVLTVDGNHIVWS